MKTTGFGTICKLVAKCGSVEVTSDKLGRLADENIGYVDFTLSSILADSNLNADDLTDVLRVGELVEFTAERPGRLGAAWTITQLAVLETADHANTQGYLVVSGVVTNSGFDANRRPYGQMTVEVAGAGQKLYPISVRIYENSFIMPPKIPCTTRMLHLFQQGECVVLVKTVPRERTTSRHKQFMAISCRLVDYPRPRTPGPSQIIQNPSPQRSGRYSAPTYRSQATVTPANGRRPVDSGRFIADPWDFLTGQPIQHSHQPSDTPATTRSTTDSVTVNASTAPTRSAASVVRPIVPKEAAKGVAKLYPKCFRHIGAKTDNRILEQAEIMYHELKLELSELELLDLYKEIPELVNYICTK